MCVRKETIESSLAWNQTTSILRSIFIRSLASHLLCSSVEFTLFCRRVRERGKKKMFTCYACSGTIGTDAPEEENREASPYSCFPTDSSSSL